MDKIAELDQLVCLAIERAKKTLFNPTPIKVVYDYKTHEISVTSDFDLGQIKSVKLKSSPKIWLVLFYGLNFDRLTLNQIAPLLWPGTSGKKKESLKEYSELNPTEYGADVFDCFLAMLSENRDYSAYKITRKKPIIEDPHRAIISRMAAYTYVYLLNHCNKPKPDLQRCLRIVEDSDGEGPIDIETQLGRQDAVARLLAVFFGYPFYGERFFKRFVTESLIKLWRIKKSPRISPENNPFLKTLLETLDKP